QLYGALLEGLRYHVPFAVPGEHERIRQVVRPFEHASRLADLTALVHLHHRDVSARAGGEELLEENVALAIRDHGNGIGPEPIAWRHELLEAMRRSVGNVLRSRYLRHAVGQEPLLANEERTKLSGRE